MKRFLFTFVLILILLNSPCTVYADYISADEPIGPSTVDELGRCTSGVVKLFKGSLVSYYEFDASVGNCIYLVQTEPNNSVVNLFIAGTDNASFYYVIDRGNDNRSLIFNHQWFPVTNSYNLNSYSLVDDMLFTNIPIFNVTDSDGIARYIDDGDVSSAVNRDDVLSSVPEGDDVEPPLNVKVIGGYAKPLNAAYEFEDNFVFQWDQTADTSDYVYQVEVMVTLGTVIRDGSTVLDGGYYDSGWVTMPSGNYNGANNITYYVSKDDLNNKFMEKCYQSYIEKTGQKVRYKGYLISKLQARIRNVCGGTASEYAVITVDKDSVSTTTHYEDEDGNQTSDDVDASWSSSDDSESWLNGDVSVTSLLSFITSGFGLLGNNGILSLMSKTFSYLPASIWTMIKFFVSMMIVISIVGLIKKVI